MLLDARFLTPSVIWHDNYLFIFFDWPYDPQSPWIGADFSF
jgi:hypothetical protein